MSTPHRWRFSVQLEPRGGRRSGLVVAADSDEAAQRMAEKLERRLPAGIGWTVIELTSEGPACPKCEGRGSYPYPTRAVCPDCGASGLARSAR